MTFSLYHPDPVAILVAMVAILAGLGMFLVGGLLVASTSRRRLGTALAAAGGCVVGIVVVIGLVVTWSMSSGV